jgi:hypothetical protein
MLSMLLHLLNNATVWRRVEYLRVEVEAALPHHAAIIAVVDITSTTTPAKVFFVVLSLSILSSLSNYDMTRREEELYHHHVRLSIATDWPFGWLCTLVLLVVFLQFSLPPTVKTRPNSPQLSLQQYRNNTLAGRYFSIRAEFGISVGEFPDSVSPGYPHNTTVLLLHRQQTPHRNSFPHSAAAVSMYLFLSLVSFRCRDDSFPCYLRIKFIMTLHK